MKSVIVLVQGLTLNVQTLEGGLLLVLWFVIHEALRLNIEYNYFSKNMLSCLSINLQLKHIFPPDWPLFLGHNSSFLIIYFYSSLLLLVLQKLNIKLFYVLDRGSFKIQHHQKYSFSFVCTRNLYNFKTFFFFSFWAKFRISLLYWSR